jgi:hypothetical protein
MCLEMQCILRGEKSALMVIEPPCELFIIRIFEIDNGILVAVEEAVFEDLARAVGHASVMKIRIRVKFPPDKTAEVSSRGRAVEAMVVI